MRLSLKRILPETGMSTKSDAPAVRLFVYVTFPRMLSIPASRILFLFVSSNVVISKGRFVGWLPLFWRVILIEPETRRVWVSVIRLVVSISEIVKSGP